MLKIGLFLSFIAGVMLVASEHPDLGIFIGKAIAGVVLIAAPLVYLARSR